MEQPNCRQLPAPIAPVGRLQVYSEDCEAGRLGVPKDSEPRIWVNYNDLTGLPHWKSWLVRGIIPKWPNYSG